MRFIHGGIALLLLAACSHAPVHEPLISNDDFGWIYDGPDQRTSRVIVVPQWHLSPQTNTVSSGMNLPQSENQLAIYRQLVKWVESGQVKTVVVEGCEGEIAHGFTTRFNGWGLDDLEKLSASELDGVMTQVGLKIKAKVGSKVKVLCGDNLELIKKHQLILSDLRGLLGFKMRIVQKRTEYIATVRELLKLPDSNDDALVLSKLDEALRSKLDEFNSVLRARNESFVRVVKFALPIAAVVIGAVHVGDLTSQLRMQNIANETFEPRGLKGDESELLGQIEALLKDPAQ